MDGIRNQRLLVLCRPPPEDKNNGGRLLIDTPNHGIRKRLPAFIPVRVCRCMANGEHRIEKEHPLLRPGRKIAMRWGRYPEITLQLTVNIQKRRRRGRRTLDRKAQPMRLLLAMVGILAKDNHTRAGIARQVQGIEDIVHIRMNPMLPVFLDQKSPQRQIGRRLKLCLKKRLPVIMKNGSRHDDTKIPRLPPATCRGRQSLNRQTSVCESSAPADSSHKAPGL